MGANGAARDASQGGADCLDQVAGVFRSGYYCLRRIILYPWRYQLFARIVTF